MVYIKKKEQTVKQFLLLFQEQAKRRKKTSRFSISPHPFSGEREREREGKNTYHPSRAERAESPGDIGTDD
jgi:hypothetical protein